MKKRNLGWRQTLLLMQAESSDYGFVKPWNFMDRRALRKLEKRGLLIKAIGWPDTWRLPPLPPPPAVSPPAWHYFRTDSH